jgi:DNA-binding transcriptional LysR family regulator
LERASPGVSNSSPTLSTGAATEAALELGPYAEPTAATTAAMMRVASGHGHAIKGTERVSVSEFVGAKILPAIFSSPRERYLELEIELILSNEVETVLGCAADVAVRMAEPVHEARVIKRLGNVTLGPHADRRYLNRAGVPRNLKEPRSHSLMGFDEETPAIRNMRQRVPGFEALHFALRTDSDLAQWKAGFGSICQVALARQDSNIDRVIPKAFAIKLGVWLAMDETLRTTPHCRAVFEGLSAGLTRHVD